MNIRLVVEKGNTHTDTIRLRRAQTIIGRQRGCQVRIPSAEVSRRHCLLRIQDGYLSAEDLSSANGTYLNGQRIQGRVVVRPGDRLEIGPVRFLADYELTPAAIGRLRQWSTTRLAEPVADLPVAEEVGDWESTEESVDVLPVTDDEAPPIPVKPANQDEQPATARFDEDDWQLPESEELRNILAQMEESKRPPKSRPRHQPGKKETHTNPKRPRGPR